MSAINDARVALREATRAFAEGWYAGDISEMALASPHLDQIAEALARAEDEAVAVVAVLLALEADEAHGNLSGRVEDAWYAYRGGLQEAPPKEEP